VPWSYARYEVRDDTPCEVVEEAVGRYSGTTVSERTDRRGVIQTESLTPLMITVRSLTVLPEYGCTTQYVALLLA
jgi:hypothetical protein